VVENTKITNNKTHLLHPKYRADIDGLRAIAVLAVVGYHAFPARVRGGFVGVDIFFVISGFLISTIIFENLERGSFSFTEFYSRRIKRIFPALLVVLIACFAFGWFALQAEEYRQLGKHIAAGAGFVLNLVLLSESGYFDNLAETKPLLHLWSLGIEEQFYIVWPLIVWAAWKKGMNLFVIAVVVIALSFALNIYGINKDATATFYSPQTRFWELVCGSLLAWYALHRKDAFENLATNFGNILSIAGVVFLGFGILLTTRQSAFPGWWSVLPVLGAVLIIVAGTRAWINRVVLSNRAIVWFGLISFPLYLWHWPLLSFAWIVESQTPGPDIRLAAVVTSIVLAWLTYRLIEHPIRYGNHSKAKTISLASLMAIAGIVGYCTYQNDGLGFRKNAVFHSAIDGDVGHREFQKYLTDKFHACKLPQIKNETSRARETLPCLQSKIKDDVEIAILGDSHAEHAYIGLAEALPTTNVAYYPINAMPRIDNKEFIAIYDHLVSSKSTKIIILSSYWSGRINEIPLNSSLENELSKLVNKLMQIDKKIYIMEDVPTFSFAPRKCKGARWPSTQTKCDENRVAFNAQINIFEENIRSLVKKDPRISLIETRDYFCDERNCNMTDGKSLLYRDSNHLNITGSQYLGKKIVENSVELTSAANKYTIRLQ
jgi:peptidoglycan/LPS O-acetylase OafA/YrhL